MEYYIHLNSSTKIVALEFTLDEEVYKVGTTWDDYLDGKWVKLSEEQVIFSEKYPDATVEEIWNMELKTPEIDKEAELNYAKATKKQQAEKMMLEKVNEMTYDSNACYVNGEERAIILDKVNTAKRSSVETITVNKATVPVDLVEYLFDKMIVFEDGCAEAYHDDIDNINACGTVEELAIGKRFPEVPQLVESDLRKAQTEAAKVDTNVQLLTFARMSINTMSLTDEQSLEVKLLYPEWKEFIGKSLTAGFKILHNDRLFKVRQEVPVVLDQDGYRPGEQGSEALYEEINEVHAGTLEDPIPYNNNMELFNGMYYSQDNVIYLCTRNTEQAVYQDLKDLVNIYVQIVE